MFHKGCRGKCWNLEVGQNFVISAISAKVCCVYHSSPACAQCGVRGHLPPFFICLHGIAFRYSDLFSSLPLELPGLCIFVHNLSSASVLYGTYALQSVRHCWGFKSSQWWCWRYNWDDNQRSVAYPYVFCGLAVCTILFHIIS